jgi:hypothetical protein
MHRAAAAWACLLALAAAAAPAAERQVVCTITVNSADEREAFRRFLPAASFDFVELVEPGRPDWLASSCRRGVQCDVLLVSGHFAGSEFYSSRPDTRETLKVDEIERVQCSGACGVFAKLKEVYLFGCDSLKPEPVKSAMPEIVRGLVKAGATEADAQSVARAWSEREAESSRARMQRLFPNVPVTMTRGAAEDPSCRFHDDRVTAARKLDWLGAELAGEMPAARMAFERLEKFLAALPREERDTPDFAAQRATLAADARSRDGYLALLRATADPALRVRMAAVASDIGWLDVGAHRAELARTIRDVVASDAVDFGEVDLICALNKDDALANELKLFNVATMLPAHSAGAAAGACTGDPRSRESTLRALSSGDERDVRMAQAFLRHRPITDADELRRVAAGISSMKASGAQVRALETLARHHIADAQVLQQLAALFSRARTPEVQRAVAEVFLRSDLAAIDARALAARLQRDRLREDPLISAAIARLL